MAKHLLLLGLLLLGACGGSTPQQPAAHGDGHNAQGGTGPTTAAETPHPPVAKTVPHELRAHGQVRQDPYYWMRDDDRDDPEILAHLQAETDYAEAMLAPLRPMREALYQEIVARIPENDDTVPALLDGFYYYDRFEAGKEYVLHCRKRGALDAAEQVFLDENREADGHDFYDTAALEVTTNGRILAYAEDTLSRRIYTVRFRDLDSGQNLPDVIEGTSGNVVWAADDRTLFYVKKEEGTLREFQVWRHSLGTEATADVMVFHETDPEFSMEIFRSRSRDYVMIASYQTLSHEFRYVDARRPTTEARVLLPREEHHEYDADHINGRFYIRTNWEARDFRLMSVEPRRSADKRAWREEIPARDGTLLEGFELFDGHLVLKERRDGISRLRIVPWRDRSSAHEITFDEPAYVTRFGANPMANTHNLRFTYESLTTPLSTFDYDMNARTRDMRKREQVVGDFDPAQYVTTRIDARARDGAQVPISIVHRRDLDRSHPQPLYLYGYGAYGYSTDPRFSSARLSLLDRGVIYAIAHIRGGQERGRAWYEAGRLLEKRHTFEDFIDVAEHLVREGYTAPEKLVAYGGSAGGLLIGAVANMRPDLFHALVADVPYVDAVTTMLDPTIPLTTFEYDEWGNPEEREYYDYMMTYSPYDNVHAVAYPSMLVITGLHDSQVQYWEPAKWVARLRATGTGANPLLFHVDMSAGHGGASGRFRMHEETAMVYAFLLNSLGIDR